MTVLENLSELVREEKNAEKMLLSEAELVLPVGAVLDTKNKVKDKATAVKENIKDMPTQTAYALHSAKEKAKENVSDFKRGMCRDRKPDRASVPTSSNSIDRISLTSVWSFKRHRKQNRQAE